MSRTKEKRQVAVGRVVTLGTLGGEIISTLARNARDVGSIPILGAIFPFSPRYQCAGSSRIAEVT